MQFDGTMWLLWEDEPVDLDHTRFVEFKGGALLDARTGDRCGSYVASADGVDATFDERYGHREVVKLRMHSRLESRDIGFAQFTPAFDPAADGYALTFSNAAYERYAAGLPANDHGTEQQEDVRGMREVEDFGIVPTFGYAFRDCPEVREMGEVNGREARERVAGARRGAMAAV